MSDDNSNDDGSQQVSVAELLARNGAKVGTQAGGRRRRGMAGGISVAELTGEIPVFTGDAAGETAPREAPVVAPEAPQPDPPQPKRPETPRPDSHRQEPVRPTRTTPAFGSPRPADPEPPLFSGGPSVAADRLRASTARPVPPTPAPPRVRPIDAATDTTVLPPVAGRIPTQPVPDDVDTAESDAVAATTVHRAVEKPVQKQPVDKQPVEKKPVEKKPVEKQSVEKKAVAATTVDETPGPTVDLDKPASLEKKPSGKSRFRKKAADQNAADETEQAPAPDAPTSVLSPTVDAPAEAASPPAAGSKRSPIRQWLSLLVQGVVAIVLGALLFKGFERLWEMLPWVALVLAFFVIVGLVAVVRVLRRTDDILSILLAVLVGGFVTLGPLAFMLSTT